ncbi:peptidase M23 [Staphylococcus simulans]|uniref:peptidoglycan DD-metalloendopeptidase family protein n=1 Tax=Staphylococcus simulans TaxID=1286 RepID=UPI000D1DFF62|nr:peptidoglycan DD-metalloendopeptidase family protein [Staphylococcus simulans]PTJ25996.1 peptidase M23 [Staphylococcus simulans]
MAEFNLGAEVSMDVDPLKASRTTLERNLKQINKSLKDQRSEFKRNELSVEQLADREKQLGKAMSLQSGLLKKRKSDLENMREELSKSNKITDEQKIKLQQASRSVVQAENQLNRYENELKQTQVAHQQVNRSTEKVKNSLGELRNRAKLSEIAFKQSAKGAEDFRNHLTTMNYTLTKSKANIELLKKNLNEVSRAHGASSSAADKLRNDIMKETVAFQVLQGRIDETTDELKDMQKQQAFGAIFMSSVNAANDKIDEIGDNFRNVGYVFSGVIRGAMIGNITTLIPVLGSAVSAIAGIGGAATAAAGGAIGLGGAYASAVGAVTLFAGMSATALKMIEDGEMRATAELSRYKTSLSGLQTQWKSIVQSNQASIFNTMSNGIDIARYSLTQFNPFIQRTSTLIAEASADMYKWVTTSGNARSVFQMINSVGVNVFGNLLRAGKSALNGISNILVQFAPLFTFIGAGIESMAAKFDTWANSMGTNNGIAKFIQYTKTNLPIVGSIFGNIFMGIFSLFTAFGSHSHSVLVSMQSVTQAFKNWAAELKNTKGFKNFIAYLNTNGPKVWSVLKNIGMTIWGLVKGMAPIGSILLTVAQHVTSFTASLTNAHPAVGGLIGALTALIGLGLAIGPPYFIAKTAIDNFRNATNAAKIVMGLFGKESKIATIATTVWTGVTKGAALATRGLGLALRFMTGPIGIIITIVGLLVAGIIHLWKTNDGFRNGVINAWNAIKNGAMAVFGFLKPYIIGIWNGIKTTTIAVWNALKFGAIAAWNAIKFAVQNPIQALKVVLGVIWNGIKTAAIAVWNAIKAGVLAIARAWINTLRAVFNGLKAFFTNLWNGIKSVAITVWNAIKTGVLLVVKGWIIILKAVFNGLRSFVSSVFNAVKSNAIKVWTLLKNTVVSIVKTLYNGVRNTFNTLKNVISSIFNTIKNIAVSVWNYIKNRVISFAKNLYNSVKSVFNALKSSIVSIFNAVKSFMANTWSAIKSKVVNLAQNLRDGVSSRFNSLKKAVSDLTGKAKSLIIDGWNAIKSKVTSLAQGLKDKVVGTFNKMKDGLSSIIGKIKGFINDMVDKVKGGLNKLIDGVNWVAGKIGMDKIPKLKLSTGTESTHTQNFVTNGKINRDTFATVGDKGKGNGPGGFRHEMIRYPNGKTAITPNRDTTAYLPKGSTVYNGAQTHAMLSNHSNLPKFAKGTLWDKAKKTGSGIINGIGDGAKHVGMKAVDTAKNVAKGAFDAIGDVMDYMENPGKLVDKVLGAAGVNFDFLKGDILGGLMKAMYKKLKTGVKNLFDGWLEEGGGADLSSFDKYPKTTPYSPNAPVPGYGFNGGRHYGIDYGTPSGTTLKAPTSGTVSRMSDHGGGLVAKLLSGKFTQFFLHLSSILKTGKVKQGEAFAKTGNSGAWTTGPHLHYQVEKGNSPFITNRNTIDPEKFASMASGGKSEGKQAPSAWRSTIVRAAKKMKVSPSNAQINGIIAQIQRESGGDAGITQDSRLKDGNAGPNLARGLLQYVPSTFDAYKVKGHGNITSGYDQLLAFFNNSNWANDIQYGRSGWGPRGSRRFAKGTNYAPKGLSMLFEKGGEILNLRGGEQIIPNDVSIAAIESVINSDIFSKVQTAVYDAISRYADEIRENKQQETMQQLELKRLSQENTDIKEQNGILKQILSRMDSLLNSSQNIEQSNADIRDKEYFPDSEKLTKMNNKNNAIKRQVKVMGGR